MCVFLAGNFFLKHERISVRGLLHRGEFSSGPLPRSLSLTSSSDSDSEEKMGPLTKAATSSKDKGQIPSALSPKTQGDGSIEANAQSAEAEQNKETPFEASTTPPVAHYDAASALNAEDSVDPTIDADRFVSGLLNSDNTNPPVQK